MGSQESEGQPTQDQNHDQDDAGYLLVARQPGIDGFQASLLAWSYFALSVWS
ncbi:hypothetical protein ILT44_05135 [Microvirga sp. BT689]|uniref:hypothetical protein n=1 Tax=Microvirga arvi TaxID=2778731 RepID=UPI00194F257B|nr:hypothetical protein [Microvirga arvi]MBM6579558.1 hypothetical protein [Microvirga arvi]